MEQKLILLVHDHEEHRLVLTAVLQHGGYGVLSAEQGADALEQARKHRPDLILLDLVSPATAGWETMALLKSDPRTTDIPVAAIVAPELAGSRERLDGAGFCGYYGTPIFLRRLLASVRCWLGVGAAGEAPPSAA